MATIPRRPVAVGSRLTLVLLLLLLAINGAAVWSLLGARRSARQLAVDDLEWQTRAQARALEAALSGLRGDLLLLAQSPSLAEAPNADPQSQRWSRLDREGALLTFLAAHPGVERLTVRAGGALEVVAGRSGGEPTLLLRDPAASSLPGPETVAARWPLRRGDEAAALEAVIDPHGLLAGVAPGFGDRLWLGVGEPPLVEASGAQLVARATVLAEDWSPPLAWNLVRREPEGRLLQPVAAVLGPFGSTVVANVAIVALAVVLTALAFRQARKRAALAIEAEEQAQLRVRERQLLHQERLASVGRLATGMAHEINNPLEGMSNYLRLLEDDLAAGDLSEARYLAGKVREGIGRIAGITRHVLSFAAAGQAAREEVDLGQLVRANLGLLRDMPAYRHLRFALRAPAEPLCLEGDPTTLHQLVLNLLLNAAQVQAGSGGEVEVELAETPHGARFAVLDRGPGFGAEGLARAFEPFFSTRGSVGLGLAICRGIVEEHRGEIRASDRPDGGACVEVILPRAAVADAPTPRRAVG